MMNDELLKTAHAYYGAIHAGDFAKLFGVLADDCTIEYYGPAMIPFAGYFKGKEKCRIFFDHVANDVNIKEFRQDDFMLGEGMVAVTGHLTLEFKATGRIYDSDYVHVLEIADGRIKRFRDFQDSAKAAYVCSNVETPLR